MFDSDCVQGQCVTVCVAVCVAVRAVVCAAVCVAAYFKGMRLVQYSENSAGDLRQHLRPYTHSMFM